MLAKRVVCCLAFCALLFCLPNLATAETQHTNLAFVNMGVGLEGLLYYEYVEISPVRSSAITGSFVTALDAVVRWRQLGLLARGNLTPATFGGDENWYSNGSLIQENDLSYRLRRGVAAVGFVLPGGLEPYLGYWYAKGTQSRKDFRPSSPGLDIAIERIRSQGIVMGLQGVFHDGEKRSLIHFYGDLMIIPGNDPIRAVTTNSLFSGLKFHSGGIGFESGGSYGWTIGNGQAKLLTSLQGNFIVLYYDGQIRQDIPGLIVEWPSNLTVGFSLMLQLGGGWFSVLE